MTQAPHQDQHAPYRAPPINPRGRAFDPDATDDERTYALLIHLSLLAHAVAMLFAFAIPVIMWQIKKDESPFLDDHGREAVNFQISLLIWTIIFTGISVPLGFITCGIGWGASVIPAVIGLIGMIQAAIAANRGEFYRYPMTFRFF